MFLGEQGKSWNFPKTPLPLWSYLKTCFEVHQSSKLNLLSNWMLIKRSKKPQFLNGYKTIFMGKHGKPWNCQKFSPHIGGTWEIMLKNFKSLETWNIWRIDYWSNSQKYNVWLTNKKPFFWKKKTKIETFYIFLYQIVAI